MLLQFLPEIDAQCVIDANADIPDNDEISISINVNGLTLPNLTDSGQGLCGVRVRFKHEHVGDLLIRLRSPSGQIVELTGPAATTSSTDFTVWDVTFVPCTQVPSPDPGFAAQWDNDQSWAVLAGYSGSYHPYNGCLESFTGSAIGLWTLLVEDAQQLDVGVIESVELIFCNPTGQNCTECIAQGGGLPTDTIEQCVNEEAAELDLTPTFSEGPLDPAYSYFYVVSRNGIVIDVTSSFNNNGLDTGLYVVCGLSVLHADTMRIQVFPPNLDIDDYENWLLNSHICFELGFDCAVLRVKPELPPFFRVQTICEGDVFNWRGLAISSPGQYFVRNTAPNGCLRNHTLSVTVLDPEPVITELVPFGCTQDIATLRGSDANFSTGVDFFWYTTNGIILTDPTASQVDVSGSGTYYLISTRPFGASSFCDDTASIVLVNNFVQPQISYLAANGISCYVDSTRVQTLSIPSSNIVIWRNAAGIEDTVKNKTVYWGEDFTVVAVTAQGCRDSLAVIIPYDTLAPAIVVADVFKNCRNDSVLLTPGFLDPTWTYVWELPNGDSLLQHEIFSPQLGVFTLTARALNGCTTIIPVSVIHTGTTPVFQIITDTFYCYTDTVPISVSSNLIESSYTIRGPFGFVSNNHDELITAVGPYTITVETLDGCTYDTVWMPLVERSTMTVGIIGDTLDCATDSFQLAIDTMARALRFNWTGPGNYMSNQATPWVRESGTYDLELRTKNGCIIEGTYEVVLDTLKPNLSITAGVIDCVTDSVRFRVIGDDDAYLYDWEGPNNYTSNEKKPWAPYVGWYYVTVSNVNGCGSFFSLYVAPDFDVPEYAIDATDITCDSLTSAVHLSTNAISFEWNRPGFSSMDSILTLPSLDTFNLYLLGSNGCDTNITYVPPVDTIHPQLDLFSDILGCHRDTVPLYYESDIDIVDQMWTGPFVQDAMADSTFTTLPGNYMLSATSQNGCVTNETIVVVESFDLPVINIVGVDTLDCIRDTTFLGAQTLETDLDILWEFPDGSQRTDSSIISLLTGTYFLYAEGPNSCIDTNELLVFADTMLPALNLMSDTINCLTPDATISVDLARDEMVNWTWPDNQNTDLPTFTSNLPGEYKAVVLNTRSGCIDSALITVRVDTASISNEISGDTTITCTTTSAVLVSTLNESEADLVWQGPSTSVTAQDTIEALVPGTYFLTSTATSLCFDIDTITVSIDTVKPTIELFGDTLKCDQTKIELTFTSSHDDIQNEWTGPNDFISQDSMPFVNTGGYYKLVVTRDNGCTSIDSILIVGDTLAPEVTVTTDLFSCDDTTAMVSAVTMDNVGQYVWIGPDGFSAMGQDIVIDRTGEFILFAFALNGCVGQDTFILDEFDQIDSIGLTVDSISCLNPSAVHRITSESGAMYAWFEGGSLVSQADSLSSGFGGNIRVSIENNRGCQWDSTFAVFIDTIAPQPIIIANGAIKCDNRELELNATNVNPPDLFIYNWNTPNGQILSDPIQDNIVIREGGEFVLFVTNTRNGCSGTDTLNIMEDTSSLQLGGLTIEQPHCNNGYNGSIEADNISGASGAVSYFINGSGPGFSPLFTSLDAGTYVITIQDQFGCTASDTAMIDDVIIRYVDIERDTVIQLGADIFIESDDNYSPDLIVSKTWTVNGEPICEGCDSLFFQPTVTGNYALTILDTNGCVVSDSVLIQVISVPLMYIPDAFSPNDDGINDEIGPYFGNNVARVQAFTIYTRWGEQVHQRIDLAPEDDFLFWDGKQKDELLAPGLFIYTISIELIDGRRINRRGEIHLIR